MTGSSEVVFPAVAVRTRTGRDLQVRAFVREEFGAVVQMYKVFEPKRIAQGLPPPDVPRIAQWLDRLEQKSEALLAWEGNKAVAHAILCPIDAASVEFTIFVHQDYREDGLGTALARETLQWAVRLGFSRAYLTTETSNYRALRLFRKLGFRTTSRSGDEVEMHLELASLDSERPLAA